MLGRRAAALVGEVDRALVEGVHDAAVWRVHAHVDKWSPDAVRFAAARTGLHALRGPQALQARHFQELGIRPDDGEVDRPGNLLVTAGLTRLLSLLNGAGGQAATNTATRLGTGNGAGTAAAGDTDLSAAAGAANRWFQVADATFPSVAANVLTMKATWASADGNYAWNEWGIDIGTPTVTSSATVNATLLNHKTSAALGTKTTGSWALTVTITIS
jgi:hypothetical protein